MFKSEFQLHVTAFAKLATSRDDARRLARDDRDRVGNVSTRDARQLFTRLPSSSPMLAHRL